MMKMNYEHTGRQNGFTIIEVLISMVIVAMILTIVYAAFTAGSRACQHGSERAQIFHTARIAMQDIISSVENLEYGTTNYLSFIGKQSSSSVNGESVGNDTLTLATLTQPTKIDDRWQAGRARVRYQINRKAESLGDDAVAEPAIALEKLVSRVNDEDLEDAYTLELSRDVVGISLRYFDESDYQDNWDSEIKERLPEFVEITLYVREGENIHLLRSGALIPHMTLGKRARGGSSTPPTLDRSTPSPSDTPVRKPSTERPPSVE